MPMTVNLKLTLAEAAEVQQALECRLGSVRAAAKMRHATEDERRKYAITDITLGGILRRDFGTDPSEIQPEVLTLPLKVDSIDRGEGEDEREGIRADVAAKIKAGEPVADEVLPKQYQRIEVVRRAGGGGGYQVRVFYKDRAPFYYNTTVEGDEKSAS